MNRRAIAAQARMVYNGDWRLRLLDAVIQRHSQLISRR